MLPHNCQLARKYAPSTATSLLVMATHAERDVAAVSVCGASSE